DAGRAVIARERAQRIPGDLGVVVAVIVDEARGDRLTSDIDDRVGSARQFADLDDLAVLDGDIAMERRHPRAVDDPAVLDQDVIRHLALLLVVVAVDYSTWRRPVIPSRPSCAAARSTSTWAPNFPPCAAEHAVGGDRSPA